jgi:hypothetical protein
MGLFRTGGFQEFDNLLIVVLPSQDIGKEHLPISFAAEFCTPAQTILDLQQQKPSCMCANNDKINLWRVQ